MRMITANAQAHEIVARVNCERSLAFYKFLSRFSLTARHTAVTVSEKGATPGPRCPA